MKWLLVIMVFNHSSQMLDTSLYTDKESCNFAGKQITQLLVQENPDAQTHISFNCIQVQNAVSPTLSLGGIG